MSPGNLLEITPADLLDNLNVLRANTTPDTNGIIIIDQ